METITIFNINTPGKWEFTSTVFSIIIVTIMMILFLLYINKKFKGADPTKPPTYFQSIIENMYTGFEKYFDGLTKGKLKSLYPYFFTLFFFIFFLSISDLIGLTPGTASLGVTLTLGFISFFGIYVAGVIGHGLFKFVFNKYKNPIELLSQFSPLLSLSLRLFGSTFAMVIIAKIVPEVLGQFTSQGFMDYIFPFFSITYSWAISGFAAAMSLIQALVFVTLTIIYWSSELGDLDVKKAKKAKVKEEKKKYKESILKTKTNKKKEK